MSSITGGRMDPAPSRWAYRFERLWLTPLFRAGVRVGLPLFLSALVVTLYLANEARRDALIGYYNEVKSSIEQRPEFMVKLMSIEGASIEVSEVIREILGLDFPISSFDLDLEEMRQRIMELDAVADARLQIKAGGILQFVVTQRDPAIVWRRPDGLEVLDRTGLRVGPLEERAQRADLPLIVGEGADKATVEAQRLFAVARPISERVRGLVRVGERRWDMVLDDGQRILLPPTGAVAALERVMAREQIQGLLDRKVQVVDMRNPERPTLRLTPELMTEIEEKRATIEGGHN